MESACLVLLGTSDGKLRAADVPVFLNGLEIRFRGALEKRGGDDTNEKAVSLYQGIPPDSSISNSIQGQRASCYYMTRE